MTKPADLYRLTDTMVTEHEIILGYLEQLEQVNRAIQKASDFPAASEHLERLAYLAHHLIEAEPHHQREERVLFPELEKRGVYGPPQVMRQEHVVMRALKHKLAELSRPAGEERFDQVRAGINSAAGELVFTLRNHIAKENNVLYPLARQIITDPEVWAAMNRDADGIGYCCFTPGQAPSHG